MNKEEMIIETYHQLAECIRHAVGRLQRGEDKISTQDVLYHMMGTIDIVDVFIEEPKEDAADKGPEE